MAWYRSIETIDIVKKIIILLSLMLLLPMIVVILPYQSFQNMLALINLDKQLHFLIITNNAYFKLQIVCLVIAILLFGFAFNLILFRKKFSKLFIQMMVSINEMKLLLKNRLKAATMPENRLWCLFVFVLFIITIIIRIQELDRPPLYDEAKTWVLWIKTSWFEVLSNYSIVGNHIFQSVLSRLTFQVFGDHLWAFRLPVFLAGIFIPLLSYILAEKIFGKKNALLSMVLIAFSHPLIILSVNARGYAIIIFLFMILFISHLKRAL